MPDYSPSIIDDFSDIRNEQMQDARLAVAQITAEALSDLSEVLRERARTEKSKTLFGLVGPCKHGSTDGIGGHWNSIIRKCGMLVQH